MKLRLAAVTTFSMVAFAASVCPRLGSKASEAKSGVGLQIQTQPRRSQAGRRRPARTATTRRKYSTFSHRVPSHEKQVCNACHKFPTANWNQVREGNAAFEDVTDYPTHASCLSCHHDQFFAGARPAICAICHTNPSASDSSRHAFPNPSEIFEKSPKGQSALSEFQINFPHDKHDGLLAVHRPQPEDATQNGKFHHPVALGDLARLQCTVCHKGNEPFRHPVDLGDIKDFKCIDCHAGKVWPKGNS